MSTSNNQQLKNTLEAALMSAGGPLSVDRMLDLFAEDKEPPTREDIRDTLQELAEECEQRGIELKQVSSGFRFQAKKDYGPWVSRLWEEKPPRYSRALLETLALIAYKQPITRSEIEEVRGVSVSTHIIKTLQERDWVKAVGHRDVPGKPALYATTKAFLDYFNLKSLDELPTLQEIRDLDKINAELDVNPDADLELEEKEAALHDAEIERQSMLAQGDESAAGTPVVDDVNEVAEDTSGDTDVSNSTQDMVEQEAAEGEEELADAVATEQVSEPLEQGAEELEVNEFTRRPEFGAADLDNAGNLEVAPEVQEAVPEEPGVVEPIAGDHDIDADTFDDSQKLREPADDSVNIEEPGEQGEATGFVAETESESYEQERENADLEDSQLTPH